MSHVWKISSLYVQELSLSLIRRVFPEENTRKMTVTSKINFSSKIESHFWMRVIYSVTLIYKVIT